MLHFVAQLLDGGQVATDPVEAIDVQTWQRMGVEMGRKLLVEHNLPPLQCGTSCQQECFKVPMVTARWHRVTVTNVVDSSQHWNPRETKPSHLGFPQSYAPAGAPQVVPVPRVVPLLSTVWMHCSTKRGTVPRSRSHSTGREYPKT